MAVRCPDPEWYVYREDFNTSKITKYNVFNNYNFINGCRKTFKKYKDPLEIEKEIHSWAKYCFWCKCEYEIVLSGIISHKNYEEKKIDVYDQLMMNWNCFYRYVLEHKAFFLRRQK